MTCRTLASLDRRFPPVARMLLAVVALIGCSSGERPTAVEQRPSADAPAEPNAAPAATAPAANRPVARPTLDELLAKLEVPPPWLDGASTQWDTCLLFRKQDRRELDVCYVECRQAGYDAIELREIQIELDPPPPEGMFSELELIEMSRIRAPFVKAPACVGCGICQYRCHTRYVVQQQDLDRSAIRVFADG